MKIALFASPGLFADGLRHVLSKLESGVVTERYDFALGDFGNFEHDFAVADLDAARPRKPTAVITQLLRQLPNTPIVALGSRVDEQVGAAVMHAGAAIYIAKSFGEEQAMGMVRVALDKAGVTSQQGGDAPVRRASGIGAGPPLGRNGRPYGLTQREMEVLSLLIMSLPNKQIARHLGIALGVVKTHLYHAYLKLNVSSRTQAVQRARMIDAVCQLEVEGTGDSAFIRKWFLPHMSRERRRRGEVLFRQGDPGNALYFIESGQVRLLEFNKVLGEGELLGEIAIFSPDHRRTCTAQCEADTVLYSLVAERARNLFVENPQFAFHLMQLAAARASAPNGTESR